MAIKRLVMHLGQPKAGSKSIQNTLFKNSDILEKNGFRYLNEWGPCHVPIFAYLFEPSPVTLLNNPVFGWGQRVTWEERQNDVKNIIGQMLDVMHTTNCETLLMSGEITGFFVNDKVIANLIEFFERYFSGIDVALLVFVRNPLTWLISLYQEHFSMGVFHIGSFWKFDWYAEVIRHYREGFSNLMKNFKGVVSFKKFEDCVNDKNGGLVGSFLTAIKFPQEEIKNLRVHRDNDSRQWEVMELISFMEDREPHILIGVGENPNRIPWDTKPLYKIKGPKFDFAYEDKLALWERVQDTVKWLKENIGIDYTDYRPEKNPEVQTYSEETIDGFIEAFPKLNPVLQKLFLEFFEKKYGRTAQVKFKRLFFAGSVPWKIYDMNLKVKRQEEATKKNAEQSCRPKTGEAGV
jgi:hypothetical protein